MSQPLLAGTAQHRKARLELRPPPPVVAGGPQRRRPAAPVPAQPPPRRLDAFGPPVAVADQERLQVTVAPARTVGLAAEQLFWKVAHVGVGRPRPRPVHLQ